MKTQFFTALAFATFAINSFADSLNRYFQLETKDTIATVTLWIDSGNVSGTQLNGVPEKDSAYGTLMGVVREDGVLHVTFNYMIEGSRQSEEQLIKLDGGKLIIGEGELEERGPGQMVLKDRKSVTFDGKPLVEVKMDEFDTEDAKAKPVTDVVSALLAKSAGVPVSLLGSVRITGGWARVIVSVEVPEGKKVKDAALATRFAEQSMQAYLKQDKQGAWQLVRQGFMAADGIIDYEGEGAENQDEAPWPLDEEFGEE